MRKALALCALLVLGGAAHAQDDVITIAGKYGSGKFFVEALRATGMDRALAGKGPYTVFVAGRGAFGNLGSKRMKALMADKAALTAVLKRHIVPGTITMADLGKRKHGSLVKSLGGPLLLTTKGMVKIEGARVVMPDMKATNGIVHFVDTVFVPKS